MPVVKRKSERQYLEEIQVLIEDTEINSRFFQVFDLPFQFPSGKTAFKINGSDLLSSNSDILIEVIDEEGESIYSEVVSSFEGKSNFVSVYIYPDTPPGEAEIIIVGVAENVPDEWKDVFNVRWSQKVNINPFLENVHPIRFYRPPKMNIRESLKSFLDRSFASDSTSSIVVSGSSLVGKVADEKYFIKLSGDTFDKRMIGGTLTVPSPNISKTDCTAVSFSTVVTDIINDTLAVVEDHYVVDCNDDIDPKAFSYEERILKAPPLNSIDFTDSIYTMSFSAAPTFSATENLRSFAKVDLTDLETFSGDVNFIRLFKKSAGSLGEFELVSECILGSKELLIDESSVNLQDRIGEFDDQSKITSFWSASVFNTTTPALQRSSSILLNSMRVSGFPTESTGFVRIDQVPKINFFEEVEYTFSARAHGIKKDKVITTNTGQKTIKAAKMRIFLTGSSFPSVDFQDNKFGRLIHEIEIESLADRQTFLDVQNNFVPNSTDSGSLVFVIDSGEWYLSDISIKTANDVGYNPSAISVRLPVGDWQRNDNIVFKAEFYDVNGKKSLVTAESEEKRFVGGNFYMGGADNLMSGSVFVGSKIGTGVEIAGLTSAYIRTADYRGYASASSLQSPSSPLNGIGGYLLWSGSILGDSTDEYQVGDVGFEFHGGRGVGSLDDVNALRFRTSTGVLEVTGNIKIQRGNFKVADNVTIASSQSGMQITTDLGNALVFIGDGDLTSLLGASNIGSDAGFEASPLVTFSSSQVIGSWKFGIEGNVSGSVATEIPSEGSQHLRFFFSGSDTGFEGGS